MKKFILGVVLALAAGTALQARTTYNDTVRTNTWSVYVQGGISGFHGTRGELYENTKRNIAPDLNIGVKYNIKPWVRVGFNLGYTRTYAKSVDILSHTYTEDNFMVGSYPAELTTVANRIQNVNSADLLGFDLNAGFNIMEFWHERRLQKLNVYAGLGLGYLHGWNHGVQTWAYDETAVAHGDGYHNVYNHSYIGSTETDSGYDGMYIPFSLSVEYDVMRNFSIGLVGQYKLLPLKVEHCPLGIWSAGVAVRYRFVEGDGKASGRRISGLKEDIRHMREACSEEKRAIAEQAEARIRALENDLLAAQSENDRIRKDAEEFRSRKNGELYSVKVLFDHNSAEVSGSLERRLERLAKTLRDNPDGKVMIIGSTSTRGLQADNQVLSDNRVAAVRAILLANGVAEDRITTEISLGERFMTESEECRRVLVAIE